jgi:hypothetical protein
MSGFQTIGRSTHIKNIQRGSVVVTSAAATATASITSVNRALSEIFNLGARFSSAGTAWSGGTIDFVNDTTVVGAGIAAGAATITIQFQVTEYYS